MTYEDVMRELESLGTDKNRKTYARHGVVGKMYGVSYADLGALKKRIKRDHHLAGRLWQSGVHDARVMATMIADPLKVDTDLLDAWVTTVDSYPVADALAGLAGQTAAAVSTVEKWTHSDDEWVGSAGWSLLAKVAREDDVFKPEELDTYLQTIERGLPTAKNRVRHCMNSALISIGGRNQELQGKALAVAARIGKVVVDHGNTDCETPDATTYILKMAERISKKSARVK